MGIKLNDQDSWNIYHRHLQSDVRQNIEGGFIVGKRIRRHRDILLHTSASCEFSQK